MKQNNESHNQTPKRQKRSRGGQPGNRNGIKHGFYSPYLSPEERRQLRKAQKAEGLNHEIEFLRIKMGAMSSNPEVTLPQLASATESIARVMAVQHRISMARGEDERLAESLAAVYDGVGRIMGLGEYRDDACDGEEAG